MDANKKKWQNLIDKHTYNEKLQKLNVLKMKLEHIDFLKNTSTQTASEETPWLLLLMKNDAVAVMEKFDMGFGEEFNTFHKKKEITKSLIPDLVKHVVAEKKNIGGKRRRRSRRKSRKSKRRRKRKRTKKKRRKRRSSRRRR